MKGLHWKLWATFLSVFIVGVVYDVPQLRAVGGIGTIVFLIISMINEGD